MYVLCCKLFTPFKNKYLSSAEWKSVYWEQALGLRSLKANTLPLGCENITVSTLLLK